MVPSSFNTGASTGTSTSSTQMLPGMVDLYKQQLQTQQNQYQNVLGAFQNQQQSLTQQLPGLYQGYDQLHQNVMNTLGVGGGGWGVAAPAAKEIARTYAGQLGAGQQGLINSGLGNSTVMASLGRSVAHDQANAYGSLGAQLAQQAAGYQAQIGLARQGAYQQGLGMQNQLGAGLGNALAGYQFANRVGGLTGGFSASNNASSQQGQSYSPAGGGYGGYGGGSHSPTSGQSPNSILNQPFGAYGQANQSLGYSPGYIMPSYGSPQGYQYGGNPGPLVQPNYIPADGWTPWDQLGQGDYGGGAF